MHTFNDVGNLEMIKEGELFEFKGRPWISFQGDTMPEEMKGILNWVMLRADGFTYSGKTEAWNRKRTSDHRIVGYWYPHARALPTKRAEKSGRKTFEALGHTWFDCSEDRTCPAELKDTKGRDWEFIHISAKSIIQKPLVAAAAATYFGSWAQGKILGFRLPGADTKPELAKAMPPAPPQPDPNQSMIDRDGKPVSAEEKQAKLVESLVGNGSIFAPPKKEIPPLFRVAPISKTGTSLWGAEHLEE